MTMMRPARIAARNEQRAQEVAAALGWPVEAAPAHPAAIRMLRQAGEVSRTLMLASMGYARWLLWEEVVDWMTLEVIRPAPAGWTLRLPIRTVWDWRDGAPGEAPTHRTPAGAGFVIDSGSGSALTGEQLSRVLHRIDQFPQGLSLTALSPGQIQLRAGAPLTSEAAGCARRMLTCADELLAELSG